MIEPTVPKHRYTSLGQHSLISYRFYCVCFHFIFFFLLRRLHFLISFMTIYVRIRVCRPATINYRVHKDNVRCGVLSAQQSRLTACGMLWRLHCGHTDTRLSWAGIEGMVAVTMVCVWFSYVKNVRQNVKGFKIKCWRYKQLYISNLHTHISL